MTRVLFVTTGLQRGGAEVMLINLLREHQRGGVLPAVLSLRGSDVLGTEVRALGIPLFSVGLAERGLLCAHYGVIGRALDEFRPDVIHGWMYHGNLLASIANAVRRSDRRIVWTIHQSLYSLRNEKPLTALLIRGSRWLVRTVDALVYVSHVSQAQHRALGFHAPLERVIPNGFEPAIYQLPKQIRREMRSELGIDDRTFVVGHVARYHPVKGHNLLLESVARLVRRRREVVVLLAGHGVTWQNQALAKQIESLDLRAHVRMLGERSDIPRLLTAMDALCVSSLSEAFPMIIGEAMASGVPCVSTDIGDCAWLIGDTGRVVPSNDAERLADALYEIIAMEQCARSVLASLARKRIIENFSIAAVAMEYCRLYSDLNCPPLGTRQNGKRNALG